MKIEIRLLAVLALCTIVVPAVACSNGSADQFQVAIANVTAVKITDSEATIQWLTIEPASSEVQYGTTISTQERTVKTDSQMVTQHGITVRPLKSKTTYHFEVISRSASGSTSVSTGHHFDTLATQSSSTPLPPPAQLTPTVKPTKPPFIFTFTISPVEIVAGQPATLTWVVQEQPASVTIDNGVGKIDPAGSKAISPDVSTTYTITAANEAGTVTKAVYIKVLRNNEATRIALSVSDVSPDGFTLKQEMEHGEPEAISAYTVEFTKGNELLKCTVVLYPNVEVATSHYGRLAEAYQAYYVDSTAIGDQEFTIGVRNVLIGGIASYGMTFRKGNVMVSLSDLKDYKTLLRYARIVESKIK